MKTRIISFALTVCMVLTMMPAMGITASAATYDIWVGGVAVTDDNKDNITGAGISGTVRYNPGTKTLTLDNATITGANSILLSVGYSAGIMSWVGGLTIEVMGTCIITPPTPSNDYHSCGIFLSGDGSNILSGDGALDTRGADARVSYGIVCDGSFIISGPAVIASGGSASYDSYGIHIPFRFDSDSDLTISGSSSVTAVGGNAGSSFSSDGISVGKTLTISGDATVNATGKRGISAPNNSCLISGGTVNATGSEVGINTDSNPLSITGGIVTAKGGQKAMSTAPDISEYTSAVTLTGASESPAQVVAAYTNEKYAKFGAMTTYSVTYDGNGGSGSMTGGTAAAGVAFPLPASTFTPPGGKAFYKWAVGSTGGTQVSANGSHTFTSDTTVYALWKPPAPSAPDMTPGTDSGVSNADNITNDSTPTFSGTTQPDRQITLISNGINTIGTTFADGSGNWTTTASTLADGNHTITAIASDSGISSDPSPGLSITIDTAAPSGYSVSIDQAAINNSNKAAMSFTFSLAEMGAAYNYTVSSSGGAGSVTGNGTITSASQQITGINTGGLADGTLTLSITLTDTAGNTGSVATDTVNKDATAPSGYSVAINQAAIDNTNKTAMSFTFGGAEAGAAYNYTVSSSGGAGSITGSGIAAGVADQITGIDTSTLADGTLTLSVILTDAAGNTGVAATDTVSKDAGAPSGYSVSIDQVAINNSNKTAMSFTFGGAEVGAAYNYSVSSSGGAGSVTGSGIAAGAADQITGIDTSTLADGTLTLSATLTDTAGNTGTAASDTVSKDTTAPIVGGFSPANNANAVSINTNMIITFDEAVTSVAGKNITIKKISDNSTVESIDAADIKVTGSGSTTITINPAATLENSTGYYLQIDAGAFKDANNNYYGGIANTTTWSFTTAAVGGGSTGGGGGSSTPTIVTKIESGGNVTATNVDKLVAEKKSLTVEGKTGEKLIFDTEALKNIVGQTKDSVKVEIKDVSADHKSEQPGRLVVSLTITAGGKHITSFGNGTATVSLPYELKAGEKAEDVTVWYLAEDGTMSEVPCSYDPVTKLATFKVNHFSLYVVGTADTSKWVNPYSDVKESSWYYDAVRYVSSNEMMQGTEATIFNPRAKTTRGMIVTILWRMENEPKATKEITFTDVKNDKYYHDAVAWASEKGIVGGYSDEQFAPEDNITREQLAVILYNYAASKGYSMVVSGTPSGDASGDLPANLSAFSDAGSIHKWGKDAMSWANAEGLINGTGSNLLDPLGAAERCQVAAILQRLVGNTMK